MTDISKYEHGQFCWIDLLSPDARAAKRYYGALFGWTAVDNDTGRGGVYTQFESDGRVVAGLGEMSDEMRRAGMPAVWNSYVSVQDADALVARAVELGATLQMPVEQILDVGRMAILADPTGASLSVWETGTHVGAALVNEPVSLSWNELATPDPAAASAFYSALFGWTITEVPGAGYRMIENAGRANGGIRTLDASMEGVPPHWSAYVAVADCGATVERAQELGAAVHVEPTDIEPGRFAVLADPQGAVLTVIRLHAPD